MRIVSEAYINDSIMPSQADRGTDIYGGSLITVIMQEVSEGKK